MASTTEDARSKRGGHRLFDHSLFPDAVILRVRGQNFVVSASYLALHSPVFYEHFYGESGPGLYGKHEFDLDPHTFGDLLDMIYPSYKKTSCCMGCSSSFETRLELALQLKLRFAVKRLIADNVGSKFNIVVTTLQEHNALDGYSYLLGINEPIAAKRPKLNVKRDASDSLAPLAVSFDFPDATSVVANGITYLVSASTLSLQSKFLEQTLFKNNTILKGALLHVHSPSFNLFLQACTGVLKEAPSTPFLDTMLALGAKRLYDFYICEIKTKMIGLNAVLAARYAKEILQHYAKLPKPDVTSMMSLLTYLKAKEQQKFIESCHNISDTVKEEIQQYLIFSKPVQIFVKNLAIHPMGNTMTIDCPKGESTTIREFLNLVEKKGGAPADMLWFTYHGRPVRDYTEADLLQTLADYHVENHTTMYLHLHGNPVMRSFTCN